MTASIFGSGMSALLAFQRALAVTGNNIANVNTEGYSRQRVDLVTRPPQFTGGSFLGSGVEVASIERVYDEFLTTQLRNVTSAQTATETFYNLSRQIDNLLADPNVGLSQGLTRFFNAVQGVADDPSSLPARQVLLTESEVLADRFYNLNRRFQDVRAQINAGTGNVVGELNSLASALAQINQDIVAASGRGSTPNGLLDQREAMIQKIAERVDVTVVPQDDGALNVFIGNGQGLVIGSQATTLALQPNGYDPTEQDIVMLSSGGTVSISASLVGGQLGGMVDFRSQVLNPGQNELGRIAAGLVEDFNAQQALGLDLNGLFGGTFFTGSTVGVLPHSNNSGGTVTASLVDATNLTASDYLLRYDGGDAYTLVRLDDNQSFAINTGGASPFTTAEMDGFSLTIAAGAAVGDTFRVEPTRNAARSFGLAITDPSAIAAADPLRAGAATNANGLPLNTGSGTITQPSITGIANIPLSGAGGDITLTFDPNAGGAGVPGFLVAGGPGGVLAYDPATESGGKQFSFPGFGNMNFTVSGIPASGDAFVITDNTGGVGDNRNALALARLRDAQTVGGTASYLGAYGQLVAEVGTRTLQADINQQAQVGMLAQARQERDAVSGVNLDEEAANLVRYQQAYEAAAQVIAVTNTLFQTLLSTFSR